MTLTPREAVQTVLQHRDVRPVPYCIKFTVESWEHMQQALGKRVDPVEATGSYVVAAHTNHGWAEVRPGFFRDWFGVVWNRTVDRTLGVVTSPLLTSPSLAGFRFPDPESVPIDREIQHNLARHPDHFQMASIGFALFERAWALTGMEDLMVYFLTEPDFVHDLLERIAEFNIGIIRRAAACGVDAIHFGDDWASQNGLMISPDLWRTFILPPFARMCAAARQAGLFVSLHSCGKVESLFPDLITAGVHVFDPFQPEVMDIWQLRDRYRGALSFWGGLSLQRTLPFGTPDDVERETRSLLTGMAPGGGYIAAPSHAMTGDVPVPNILRLIDVLRSQPTS